jgi:hypothetical protein
MWIIIGGPCSTGASSAAALAANLRRLNEAARALLC